MGVLDVTSEILGVLNLLFAALLRLQLFTPKDVQRQAGRRHAFRGVATSEKHCTQMKLETTCRAGHRRTRALAQRPAPGEAPARAAPVPRSPCSCPRDAQQHGRGTCLKKRQGSAGAARPSVKMRSRTGVLSPSHLVLDFLLLQPALIKLPARRIAKASGHG